MLKIIGGFVKKIEISKIKVDSKYVCILGTHLYHFPSASFPSRKTFQVDEKL